MWQFWLDFQKLEPTCLLGGIYASKPGYHNYRDALPSSDYSVKLTLDKQGPGDKAAAIDLTFPDAQSGRYETIMKYASRLLASGRDPNDPRGNYLREFYGQADSDTQVEGWDFQYLVVVTSDSSHLWHIHLSFLRAFLNDPEAFRAVLSILRGETVAQWTGSPGGVVMFCNYGDRGPIVETMQRRLLAAGGEWPGTPAGKGTSKVLPAFGANGQYNDETAAALARVVGSGDGRAYGPSQIGILDRAIATTEAKRNQAATGPAVLVPHTHKPGEAVAT